ncbi:Hypothetical predicted protein [Mytilus galloprovincialis]|uniref:3-beta hydroxysteroid dehydrogenase/isomerase domain-containing protein n=1 Tax=Mytilus galloprovincialis TaxID=29158 RepID=A0A8B6GWA5_MYTGA|nr:Hypothetical predicted protein [Mytilus galloprovincialis]
MKKFVVLVTGGSGFLGQHVVKHLQIYAENVREIRVLDMVPYEQKLDFQSSKPLRIYSGSITDNKLVNEACHGTDIVLHIASKIDYSNFPDKKVLQEVNVKGTETVLSACRRENVPNLIYCGSASIYFGGDEARAATETTIKTPSKLCFGEYAKTKTEAQNMVLSANDSY